MAGEIRRFRPDVVQTWMYHSDLIGGLAALLAGRPPVIWGIRNAGLDPASSKWTTRRTRDLCALLSDRLPARIVSCSERGTQDHVRAGYSASRMVFIPNGFDLERFEPRPGHRDEFRREIDVPADAALVGMVARFHPAKDFPNFARAAAQAARDRPETWFVLCGDGVTSENQELTTWLREAGVLGRTRLLGRRNDVARVLSALDVFTLSSATEGFPNALGEAMAAGLPCVTTDAGDCSSILGDAGIVVAPRGLEGSRPSLVPHSGLVAARPRPRWGDGPGNGFFRSSRCPPLPDAMSRSTGRS